MIKTILITGASSGIGEALAYEYAKPGVTLYLTGRDEHRLNKVAEKATSLGAICKIRSMDVTYSEEVKNCINEIFQENFIDLIIASAGISAGTSGKAESETQIRRVFDVNINGVLNTILPAIPYMESARKGQIAIISSIAGFISLPSSPAYSASKSCIKTLGEALRIVLKRNNVKFSVIAPGYIKTPMTDVNNFRMPFLMEATKAANIIKRGLEKDKGLIAFPLPMYILVRIADLLPMPIKGFLFNKLPGKKEL